VVTNVVDFGAFAEIEEGIEGLIHVSELTEGSISHPREVVKKGDLLLLRIIRIDARRKRLGLSLKRVLESEWAEWAARLAVVKEEKKAEAEEQHPPEPEEEKEEPDHAGEPSPVPTAESQISETTEGSAEDTAKAVEDEAEAVEEMELVTAAF
jgi:small subunit ribosomal protein S1